jgi:superfamily II DNA or RNA helicase
MTALTQLDMLRAEVAPLRPGLSLRPYQIDAKDAVLASSLCGVSRQLVVLPTGAGKTILFSTIIAERGQRALILAHRDELIQQAVDKFKMVSPGSDVGIVKAERDEHRAAVVVASVQTLARSHRLQRITQRFGTIVVDEAHHAAAESYLRILEHFGSFDADGPLTLGVTATADRADGKGIGQVFDTVTFELGILDLIRDGYLVDLNAIQVRIAANLDAVKTRHGDWAQNELGDALMDANAPAHAVTAYQAHASGRKALVFTPTVKMAYAMAQAFSDAGVPAEAIDGALDIRERHRVLERFHRGRTRVLCNCAVLTEGYDEPSVDCVIVARPTKSRSLYVQMIGRGTRLHPGKDNCLILDLVGASTRHDLITTARLFGLMPDELKERSVSEATQLQQARNDELDLTPNGEMVAAKVDLFKRRPLHWIQIDPNAQQFMLPLGEGFLTLESDGHDVWDVRRYAGSDEPSTTLDHGLSLEMAQGIAEEAARANGAGRLVDPEAPWRQQPASEKQLATLRRMRIEIPEEGLTKGAASDLLSVRFAGREMKRRRGRG